MKNKLLKNAGLLAISNFVVKFFGLFREILMAKYYGTSIYTDAYIIANNIPTVLFAAIGVALSTTFIPMYSKIKEEKEEKYANSFTLHLIIIVIIICCIITTLGENFTDKIVLIFASGFKGETLNRTISFSRILFPSIFGMALMNLFGSYLQLHENFKPIAFVPILSNLSIIVTLIFSHYLDNPELFVWGTLMGIIVQVIFYLPWVMREGLFSGTIKGLSKDKYLRRIILLIVPVFLGETVNEVNTMVDKSLVSGLDAGSISSLNYSYKIINLLMGVIVVSLATLLYPKLSKLAAEKDIDKFKRSAEYAISLVATCIFPITIFVIIFRFEIIRILFERGNFDVESTNRTAIALQFYSIGLPAIGIREILSKIFYSMQDTKTPMINGVICAVLNIVLDFFLIYLFGFKGAALATSIVAYISIFNLLKFALRKGIVRRKILLKNIGKNIVGSIIITFLLIVWKATVLSHCKNILLYYASCILGVIISFIVYIFVLLVLKNDLFVDGGNKNEE